MYKNKEFLPLSLEDGIKRVLPIMTLFELNNINIIRVGLQPSDDLREDGVVIGGPFHPAFKELVETKIYGDFLKILGYEKLEVVTHEKNISKIVGMKKKNKLFFMNRLTIKIDNTMDLNIVEVNKIKYTRKEILNKILESGI